MAYDLLWFAYLFGLAAAAPLLRSDIQGFKIRSFYQKLNALYLYHSFGSYLALFCYALPRITNFSLPLDILSLAPSYLLCLLPFISLAHLSIGKVFALLVPALWWPFFVQNSIMVEHSGANSELSYIYYWVAYHLGLILAYFTNRTYISVSLVGYATKLKKREAESLRAQALHDYLGYSNKAANHQNRQRLHEHLIISVTLGLAAVGLYWLLVLGAPQHLQ